MVLNNEQSAYLREIGYTEDIHNILRVFVEAGYISLSPDSFEEEGPVGDAFEAGWLVRDSNGLFCLSQKAHAVLITLVSLR